MEREVLCDASPPIRSPGTRICYLCGTCNVGAYSVGVFHSGNLVKSKVDTRNIGKEGRSEKRFTRRTEEQNKDFLRGV
jgi:hypothetical protein